MIIFVPRKDTQLLGIYRKASRQLGFRKVVRLSREANCHQYLVADATSDEVFDFVLRGVGQPTYGDYLVSMAGKDRSHSGTGNNGKRPGPSARRPRRRNVRAMPSLATA